MKKYQKAISLTLITGFVLNPISVFALEKSETIYSNLNPDGDSYKTVVSNHLSWLDEGDVEDDTELKDILNIGGSEEFEKKENKLSWKSKGNDIYYQGQTEKELPIKTKIKYYLNDEEKTAEEIIGKEGSIKIKIHFENELKSTVLVNGRYTDLYTPFVTMIGTTLNSKENKNITINNGKVIGTGSRYMVVGLASPGLYDSIGLKDLENLDEITLSYETTNFSLNTMYIVSTPKLLEETDLKVFDKMDELYYSMHELQKNMDKLENGAKELANGANVLNIGTNELSKGIKSALDGVNKLKAGANELDNGLNQAIPKLNEIQTMITKINLSSKLKQLSDLKTGNMNAISTLTKTNSSLAQALQAQKLDIKKSETELQTTLKNLLAAGLIDSNAMTQIITAKKTYDGNNQMIYLLNLNNQALDEMLKTFNTIAPQLSELNKGIEQLKTAAIGATTLNNGIGQLQNGIQTMYNAAGKLSKGTKDLSIGATTLSEGATAFNNQGIKKLNNYASSLKNYSDKLEALTKLSEEYKGFTSTNSNNTNFVSVVKSAKVTYKR